MQKCMKMLLALALTFAIFLILSTEVLATQQRHVHNWQCQWSDDSFHCVICDGCGEERTTTHSNNAEGICKVCGHTPHEHIWEYTKGENYDYNHGLHCTKCAATSDEDHIYGSNGKCTVCGNGHPHEHQWKWDGKKTNDLHDHYMVCSCGATTAEDHYLFAWDGKAGDYRGHRVLCGVCKYPLIRQHVFSSEDSNKERCAVCGYPDQLATVTGNKSSETATKETKPAETKPNKSTTTQTQSIETQTEETTSAQTEPTQTQMVKDESTDMKPTSSKTIPNNSAQKDSPQSSSVWVWVAAALVVAGGLGTAMFFLKKKSS